MFEQPPAATPGDRPLGPSRCVHRHRIQSSTEVFDGPQLRTQIAIRSGRRLMCGIAGFVGWRGSNEDAGRRVERMCDAIRHRGPDDYGAFVGDGAALGMRRLSIIDVAGGSQPIGNETGRVQVVYNGEIYNHHELRRGLQERGHRFSTRSDTEVLVHLYEEQGASLVRELNGMFGFAIWDRDQRKLVVGRDRVGIKPIYYWDDGNGGLGYGSELRSLLASRPGAPEIDREAILAYFRFGYVPDPQSIFEGVHKLPPGHTLTWTAESGPVVERYWSPVAGEAPPMDAEEATEALRELLLDAVRCRLESEVPLGAFLSGGIDSSTVVALMSRIGTRRVRTFSIGFDDPRFNEAPHAARVAAEIGTEHTELIVRPDADVLVEQVIRSYDEPFADSSALPTYLVSQLARTEVTVSLSGDGGDELFAGYTRYGETMARDELTERGGVRPLMRALGRSLPHVAPGRNRLIDMGRNRRGRYAATVSLPLDPAEGGLLRPELLDAAEPLERCLDGWFDDTADRDFLTQMTLVDMQTYLPGDILTKVDRASMASSLEARVPILDHRVVEFAVGLSSSLKRRDGVGKWILRRAIEGVVPDSVLTHPKKGFAVPLVSWFRNELDHRVEALTRPTSRIHEWVDPEALGRVVREHRVGRRDHSVSLWRMMVLDIWLDSLEAGLLALPSEPGRVHEFVAPA